MLAVFRLVLLELFLRAGQRLAASCRGWLVQVGRLAAGGCWLAAARQQSANLVLSAVVTMPGLFLRILVEQGRHCLADLNGRKGPAVGTGCGCCLERRQNLHVLLPLAALEELDMAATAATCGNGVPLPSQRSSEPQSVPQCHWHAACGKILTDRLPTPHINSMSL